MNVKQGIVFGAPRSGTTFLMDALEALPGAEAVTGNLVPVGIAHLAAQDLPEWVQETLQRSFRGAFTDYLEGAVYRARAAAVRKWWISSRRPGELGRAIQGQRRETAIVYKEPFLAFAPALPFLAFPDARLVYLLRDGRDVADSLVRSYDVLSDERLRQLDSNEVMIGRRHGELFVPWWVAAGEEDSFLGASQYGRAIWMWREMIRRSQAFLEQQEVRESGRVITVRYEELMSDPLPQGERIVAHLQQQGSSTIRRRLAGAHTRSLGNFSRRDRAEIEAAERIAGAELEELGYTRLVSRR